MITHSRARCLRVALGLSTRELARRLELRPIDVARIEDGDRQPSCGWAEWEAVLDAELARWVAADGRPWNEIWPTPFDAARLRRAAGNARIRRDHFTSAAVAHETNPVAQAPEGDSSAGPATAADLFGSTLDW